MQIMTILSRKTTNEINVSTKPQTSKLLNPSASLPHVHCVTLLRALPKPYWSGSIIGTGISTVAAFWLEKNCKWLSKNCGNPATFLKQLQVLLNTDA